MVLDGSSHESALSSVSALLGLPVEVYRDALRCAQMPEYWLDTEACFEAFLDGLARVVPDVRARVAALPETFSCVWFHASRAVDPDSFERRGILTLAEMRPELDALLERLIEGLESDGEDSGIESSYWAKQDLPADGGPHAFLLRSAAVLAPRPTHQYMRIPEYVEDFAGLRLGGNRGQLERRFQEASTPCLVKFQGVAGRRELQHILLFALVIEQGHSEGRAARVAHTCMAPDGKTIPPERILAVETFPKDAFDEPDDARAESD
jgi:hypothetical protein